MNTVSVVADLELINNRNKITVSNSNGELIVTVEAESAATLPLSLFWNNRKWISKSRYLSHPILIVYNETNLIRIEKGDYKILSFWKLVKLILGNIF